MNRLIQRRWFAEYPIFIILLSFLNVSITVAQSSTNYAITRSTIAQGGGISQSTNYRVEDTIGQSYETGNDSSSNYSGTGGFFGGGGIPTDMTEEDVVFLPTDFQLKQNYPNPFNPETTIEYRLPEDGRVTLFIYNMMGQAVRRLVDAEKNAGYYRVVWDGCSDIGNRVVSGVYVIHIRAGSFSQTRKLVLVQ